MPVGSAGYVPACPDPTFNDPSGYRIVVCGLHLHEIIMLYHISGFTTGGSFLQTGWGPVDLL